MTYAYWSCRVRAIAEAYQLNTQRIASWKDIARYMTLEDMEAYLTGQLTVPTLNEVKNLDYLKRETHITKAFEEEILERILLEKNVT
jgi:hypothetical protein